MLSHKVNIHFYFNTKHIDLWSPRPLKNSTPGEIDIYARSLFSKKFDSKQLFQTSYDATANDEYGEFFFLSPDENM